ncbi:MAG: hypothetical protein M9907_18655 [Burkholderiaceae bacterium]|nr:hypothetical protein [Burkholderiaceae bacterium]
MNLDPFGPLIGLEFNGTLELHDALDTEVVCVSGLLWVIEPWPGGERILRPGESCAIRRNGRALVKALEPSLVCAIEPPAVPVESTRQRGGRHAARIE